MTINLKFGQLDVFEWNESNLDWEKIKNKILNEMRILMKGSEMRHRHVSAIVVLFCLMLCSLGQAIGDIEIDIFLLNTEFFFDSEEPHGQVVGKSVPVPTAEQYEAKLEPSLSLLIHTE